jgi:hypothetical protein
MEGHDPRADRQTVVYKETCLVPGTGVSKRIEEIHHIINLSVEFLDVETPRQGGLKNEEFVRFQVLTAASTKMTVFWDVALCSLAENDRRFRGAYCLHQQGDE